MSESPQGTDRKDAVYISLEFTPNPNTLKYSVNREILPRGAVSFLELEKAKEKSPLAARLLQIDGISGVMFGSNFVTVTKAEGGDWDQVHESASQTLEDHLNKNEPVFTGDVLEQATGSENDSEAVKKIREIIDNEIRPAVAMDGGDITFERFDEGVVYLFLQGSCAGCPSSTMTLKMGIENRLKEVIPEVKEVVSV